MQTLLCLSTPCLLLQCKHTSFYQRHPCYLNANTPLFINTILVVSMLTLLCLSTPYLLFRYYLFINAILVVSILSGTPLFIKAILVVSMQTLLCLPTPSLLFRCKHSSVYQHRPCCFYTICLSTPSLLFLYYLFIITILVVSILSVYQRHPCCFDTIWHSSVYQHYPWCSMADRSGGTESLSLHDSGSPVSGLNINENCSAEKENFCRTGAVCDVLKKCSEYGSRVELFGQV